MSWKRRDHLLCWVPMDKVHMPIPTIVTTIFIVGVVVRTMAMAIIVQTAIIAIIRNNVPMTRSVITIGTIVIARIVVVILTRMKEVTTITTAKKTRIDTIGNLRAVL